VYIIFFWRRFLRLRMEIQRFFLYGIKSWRFKMNYVLNFGVDKNERFTNVFLVFFELDQWFNSQVHFFLLERNRLRFEGNSRTAILKIIFAIEYWNVFISQHLIFLKYDVAIFTHRCDFYLSFLFIVVAKEVMFFFWIRNYNVILSISRIHFSPFSVKRSRMNLVIIRELNKFFKRKMFVILEW